jgi:nucleotide-binding universal stress UspA family protein
VVAGYAESESGEDARALGERLVEADGGELEVVHFDRGSPAKRLREMAERGDADLIVLGSHHAARGFVTPGGVAEHLLKAAPARLLIAPRGFVRAQELGGGEPPGGAEAELPFVRDELRVIAVGFNGSLESRAALDEALILAERFGATIRLVAVREPAPAVVGPADGESTRPVAYDLQAALHETCSALPSTVRAQPIYDRGEPVAKLLERAGEGVDLLVLGSRGFGPVMRAMVGSVSAKVIRRAPCAVMIVPRPSDGAG